MMSKKNFKIDKLFEIPDAFRDSTGVNNLFFEAIKEAVLFHYENSPFFKGYCDNEGFSPNDLNAYNDIEKIPYVFVDTFKHHEFSSVPQNDIIFKFASSGTKGIVTKICWDKISMKRQGEMRKRIMETFSLVSNIPARYMIFSYDYSKYPEKGASYAHGMYSTFAPAIEKYYALTDTFNIEESVKTLSKMAKQNDPVRVLGFPSFTYFTVKELMKKQKKLPLNPQSLIINGGGWKMHTGQEISKEEYRHLLSDFFEIPSSRIRDVFGMVEHGVPYISCTEGNFHESIYSKIFVRAPISGKILSEGEQGLLQFISPYIKSMPTISILSSDIGVIRNNCPCGIKRPYFTVLRRGGMTAYKGCAITANELLSVGVETI